MRRAPSILSFGVLALAVAATLLFRQSILSWRHERGETLGITRQLEAPGDRSRDPTEDRDRDGVTAPSILLTSAATGVFRALAIDYLWIRAIRLESRGQVFESAATAKLVTTLQPRLPAVWTFQARRLAYNITPSLPPEERFPWVLEAISILRDGALRQNPDHPAILLDLAFIFQHKIGLDFDDAGYLYRARLAEVFEPGRDVRDANVRDAGGSREPGDSLGPGDARRRWDVLRQWGIRNDLLARVEGEWGVRLDFRAAESHAVYWASVGLERPGTPPDAITRRALELVSRGAILQLLSGGRAVPAPARIGRGPRLYAFLPDLRMEEPVRRVIDLELHRVEGAPSRKAVVEDFATERMGRLATYFFLFGRDVDARRVFEEHRGRLVPGARSFDDFLLAAAGHLTNRPAEDGTAEDGTAGDGTEDPERLVTELVSLLDAALILDLAGEPVPAAGFRAFARVVHAAAARREAGAARREAPDAGVLPAFEACVRAVARRRAAPWRLDAELWRSAPTSVREIADAAPRMGEGPAAQEPETQDRAAQDGAADDRAAESLGLPAVEELPFRLEILDPSWRRRTP